MAVKASLTCCTFLVCLCAGIAAAQDDAPTPGQEAEIRGIADGINGTCAMPMRPVIPDGSTASQQEMMTAQTALKSYIDAGNAYLGCLQEVETGWGAEATINQVAVLNYLYNGIVEDLQDRAEAFNTALNVFRSRAED